MERTPVSSSNIQSIGYDSDSSILEVEFITGRVYQYSGVPDSEYEGLMNASSHGTYLNAHIKGNYPYTEI